MTICAYCHRTLIKVGYSLIKETDSVLDSIVVGRECVKKAEADGWELPQRIDTSDLP